MRVAHGPIAASLRVRAGSISPGGRLRAQLRPPPPLPRARIVAQMNPENRALCFFYANPPEGYPKLPASRIAQLVKKTDGSHPTEASVRECVRNFHKEKKTRGRKTSEAGCRGGRARAGSQAESIASVSSVV